MPPKVCRRCGEPGHSAAICTSETVVSNHAVKFTVPPVPAHTTPYIDTHCHVDYMCEAARAPVWSAFLSQFPLPKTCAGLICTFCDTTALLSSFSQLDDLMANHPDSVYFTAGLHPHNSRYYNERVESRLVELVTHPRCVGWGEIGLDATSEKKGGSDGAEQAQCFLRQMELAGAVCPDKAIQIHYRGDTSDALEAVLSHIPAATTKLHLHSWGVPDVAGTKRLLATFPHAYFGLTSVAENNKMRQVISAIPLDRILLETDGPYLLPKALRPPKGAAMAPPNHPGNIPFIARAVAEIHRVSIERVLGDARENTLRIYGLRIVKRDDRSSSSGAAWALERVVPAVAVLENPVLTAVATPVGPPSPAAAAAADDDDDDNGPANSEAPAAVSTGAGRSAPDATAAAAAADDHDHDHDEEEEGYVFEADDNEAEEEEEVAPS